jgi:tetratricopeptide (TPR) repeat protein
LKTLTTRLLFIVSIHSFLSVTCVATGQSSIFSPGSISARAYEQIINGRFSRAGSIISQQRATHQNNPDWILLDNYLDCLRLFILEDGELYDVLKSRKKIRLDQLNKMYGEEVDINYVKADIQLQWAAVRFKFGDYFSAFNEVRRAYKLLKKNTEEYDVHIPTEIRLAILETLIGTIPDQYQWGVRLIGLQGDVNTGLQRLDKAIQYTQLQKSRFEYEALAAKSLLELHLNNKPEIAERIIENSSLKHLEGPLFVFLAASIYRKNGQNDKALSILQSNIQKPEYQPFPYLLYMKGECLLRNLDMKADREFLAYIKWHKGDQYIGAAFQKLAWHARLFKSDSVYKMYMDSVLERGINKFDEDKSALREAEKGLLPHPALLRARLLFDGGYYERAKKELDKVELNALIYDEYLIEYYYRKGRNYHRLKAFTEAIDMYEKTIQLGENHSSYYACNAALLIGQIHEQQQNQEKARIYYKFTLKMKPEEYRSGIHQKAKAGLQRLK